MISGDASQGRFGDVLSSRAFLFAVLFWIGMCVYEPSFLTPKLESIVLQNHFENGNYLRLIGFIALSAGALGLSFIFYFVALASSWRWRALYFAIFFLSTLIEYNHHYAFAGFSDFHNAAVGLFVGDSKFILDALRMYLNPLFLPPVLVFGALLLMTKPWIRRSLSAAASVLILFTVFFSASAYFTRNYFFTLSTSATARTLIGFPVIWYLGTINGYPRSIHYATPREPLSFQAESKPQNNIVLIVDESVRGDYLSVNGYPKPTTVFLDDLARKGLVANWGIAAAGSTCSSPANNLLLTGLTELPDYDFKLFKMPTIFQYAKAMNYRRYYIDGQVSNLWNGKISDRPDFGEYITADDMRPAVTNDYELDREVARRIRSITWATTGNFIWVNKHGVHKPYADRYPGGGASRDRWSTIYEGAIDRPQLISEYEQAITYNSNLFFSELFAEGVAPNTFFIYTSDHGQTLQENGEVASHCSTSRSEAIVPLLIITNDSSVLRSDVTYKASHANIFPTILDLMNVPINERRETYSLSLLTTRAADSVPRYYTSGDLHGVGSTRTYTFD